MSCYKVNLSLFSAALFLLSFVSLISAPEAIGAVDNPDLNGRITNADTGENIGYAHLYLEQAGTGTASGPDGRFRLRSSLISVNPSEETLRVSAIGYETLRITLSDVMENPNSIILKLKPSVSERETALVMGDRMRSGKANNTNFWWRMGINRGSVGNYNPQPTDHVSYGLAQPVSIEKDHPVRLRYAEIAIGSISQMGRSLNETKDSPSDSLLLRFSMVNVGEDGLPGDENLISEQILKTVAARSQKIKVDLSDHDIIVEKSFFLIIELLIEDPETYHNYFPLFEAINTGTRNYHRYYPHKPWSQNSLRYFSEIMYEVGYEY